MNWESIVLALFVSVAMIVSYLWGYRDGVKYCARQMEPLAKLARETADLIRDRKR
jgi:hypothetical protein